MNSNDAAAEAASRDHFTGGLKQEVAVQNLKRRVDDAGMVRPLDRHDLPIVAAMMARIAHQQRDAEPMDAAILHSLLFDSSPRLLGLAAERFGCTVGYALIRPEQDSLILEQIVVMEGSRGLGLGRELVDRMRDLGDERGCRMLVAAPQAGMQHADGFYASVGLRMVEPVRMPA